ncbi:MAG: BrnT family toxin [Steroidobacteraceae bacterium]
MEISFDPTKSRRNAELRGLPFERAADFDLEHALVVVDDRRDYGERRYRALGMLGDKLHALVFTETARGIRVISLRRASKRERTHYEQSKATGNR